MANLNAIIPEIVNNFNVYVEGNKLLGVSGEVELPELEAMTDTVNGAGIFGEFDAPATGHFSATEMTVPFAVLHPDVFKLMDITSPVTITLRGSVQGQNPATGEMIYYPVKIVVRGKATSCTLGNFNKGKKGEPEITLQILYIKVVIDGGTALELDKLNGVYVLNGVDMLAQIRKHI